MQESERDVLQTNVEKINQNKDPLSTIGGYAVVELLGSGAFGSVYKVHKIQHNDQFLALKEIRCSHAGLGRTAGEQSANLGRLMNEVEIMREQLRHPNVVRYHKCFQEGMNIAAVWNGNLRPVGVQDVWCIAATVTMNIHQCWGNGNW